MKRIKYFGVLLIILLFAEKGLAQEKTQTIRGRVIDATTKQALPGANIVLLDSARFIGVAADENGYFRLEKVPIGRRKIKVSFIGYKEQIIPLILNTGKESVVEVELEEAYIKTAEVVVSATKDKTQSNNEMAKVSSRLFTIEETERYAGSRGDPARMAMNFAGVSGANDQRNDIVIRGNSPLGLLWRLEDIEIPNPNHFASAGSTGGPVSILNNNTLSNSDFMTAAFPAEYVNALSGVFDLKMRPGNNEKYEFLGQIGFNGVELGAEGPISRSNRSSFLANYRYSTLDFMEKMGMDLGTGTGVPRYQDFTYKLNFPFSKGVISLFGLGGTSQIAILDSKKDTTQSNDMYTDEKQDLYNGSSIWTSGLSFTRFFGNNTNLKVVISGFRQEANTRIDTLGDNNKPHFFLSDRTADFRASMATLLSHRFNNRINFKTGFYFDRMGYDFQTKMFDRNIMDYRYFTDESVELKNGHNLFRAFNQWIFRLTENVSILPGISFIHFALSGHSNIEPRAAIAWDISSKQHLSFGYGLHSRIHSLYSYLLTTHLPGDVYLTTNKNLDFSKAHHFVASYQFCPLEHFRVKTEAYYQTLFSVPVETTPSSWSMLNSGASWGTDTRDSLVNKGTGKNVGLELTLEKFFCHNYYFLVTASLFDSKYKGSDGIERNTTFNGTYVCNALFGKEFPTKKGNVFFTDIKATYAGGKRYTPINLEQSRLKNETVWDEGAAYSKQFPEYLKVDFKLGYRSNGKKTTQEWMIYIENITNHKNVLMQTYSKTTQEIRTIYQMGIFPMMQWRIYF